MALKGRVHYEAQDGIAILTVDNPPVNPLSSGVRQGLSDGVSRALADDQIQAMVLTGAGRAFIAGADISEFGKPPEGPGLHDCLRAMEESTKPIVAAINGTAFGGGLEVALCCDFRVATPKVQVGLPEVKLGLLPGAGGTQRLPRLAGVQMALDAMLTGRGIPAAEAEKMGVVDAVVSPDALIQAAIKMAKEKAAAGETRKIRGENTRLLAEQNQLEDILEAARKKAARSLRGQFAPEMIIQCVEAAATIGIGDFDKAMEVERNNFMQCLAHPQRAAMIHIFFAERQTAKIPDIPKETETKPIHQAGVVGCGTMGGGIAMCFANAGLPVTVLETDGKALERGLGVIRSNYASQVKRGRITQEQYDQRIQRIKGVTDYGDLASMDMVIEAVYENLDLKKEIFQKLDAVVKKDALLMSNTSALDVDQIAACTSRPSQVAGMHFFSPANVMRLLEVVRSKHSDKSTIATAMTIGRRLAKVPVLSRNCPGFIGNRMLSGYTNQGSEIMLSGATPYQVDQVMTEFGMPMGPFQMADLVGLDLGWRARKLAKVKPEDVPRTALVSDRLCEMERFGQKNGRGFYIYEKGSRAGRPDPEVVKIVEEVSESLGLSRKEVSNEEILKRSLYPLVNEGARILEEGIALRASDIDVVYINGYGFPAYRGGPMFYADQVGLAQVCEELAAFQGTYGDFWKPAPLLKQLADAGESFSDFDKRQAG